MDWQALCVGAGAVITAVGGVIAGIYTGANSRRKDENSQEIALEEARLSRDKADVDANRQRIEDIAADAREARIRFREAEQHFEKEMRRARANGQRGWDLARYHFGIMATLHHLLNNLFTLESLDNSDTPEKKIKKAEFIILAIQNAMIRVKNLEVPESLEQPIPPYPDERLI